MEKNNTQMGLDEPFTSLYKEWLLGTTVLLAARLFYCFVFLLFLSVKSFFLYFI
jgi:hypothetical protein